jgi:MerR family transcriptional regulator, copper efflux regulator
VADSACASGRLGLREWLTRASVSGFRVAAILVAKEAGFALPDIRAMLTAGSAPARHEVMARHRAALQTRIAQARTALAMLEGGQTCEHDDLMTCPHFRELLRNVPGCADPEG